MKIVILGDLDTERPSRSMIGRALEHSAVKSGVSIDYAWISSLEVDEGTLAHVDGVFVAPGSPHEHTEGIIRAIEIARKDKIPCLGTCGGFQRIIMEYAINVLGFENVEHQEIEPDATNPLFSHLSCSLAGKQGEVIVSEGTKAFSIYGRTNATESFSCSYGLNESHTQRIQSKDLRVSARDRAGEPRIVELANHPFLIGTLFVPQVSSTADFPHVVISAFLKATKERAEK